MPIYHHFYVERRAPSGWVVPPDFAPEPWTFECDRLFGGFAWVHPRCGWLDLFFGADAIFSMRPGPPDDRRGSALLRYLDQFYDYERNEDRMCWLSYPALLIDCWDSEVVTVAANVQARHAILFGDGTQSFPRAALVTAGASDEELEVLHKGRPVRAPVATAFGRQRNHIAGLSQDEPVEVTWRATITELVGGPYSILFKGLRQYGPDEELRILSKRG